MALDRSVIQAASTVVRSSPRCGRLLAYVAGVLVLLLGLTFPVLAVQAPAHGHTVQDSVADTRVAASETSDRVDSIPVKSRDGEMDRTEEGSRKVSAIGRAQNIRSSTETPRAGLSRGFSSSALVTDRGADTPALIEEATLLTDGVADGRLAPAVSARQLSAVADSQPTATVPTTVTPATTVTGAADIPRRDVLLLVSVAVNTVLGLLIVVHQHGPALTRRLLRWLPGPDDPGPFGESAATDEVGFDDPSVPDSQLVLELLDRNDSQLRQSAIVERTGWSKAKVSRLLGEMASREVIVKIPLGRQNLICLAGHEPEIAKPRSRD